MAKNYFKYRNFPLVLLLSCLGNVVYYITLNFSLHICDKIIASFLCIFRVTLITQLLFILRLMAKNYFKYRNFPLVLLLSCLGNVVYYVTLNFSLHICNKIITSFLCIFCVTLITQLLFILRLMAKNYFKYRNFPLVLLLSCLGKVVCYITLNFSLHRCIKIITSFLCIFRVTLITQLLFILRLMAKNYFKYRNFPLVLLLSCLGNVVCYITLKIVCVGRIV